MPATITCPACDASFTPAKDLRGKKAFCPDCGVPLVVTSAGGATRDEIGRPAPALPPAPARGSNPFRTLVALALVALLLLGPAVGLGLYLLGRGQEGDQKKQAARQDEQPQQPQQQDEVRPVAATRDKTSKPEVGVPLPAEKAGPFRAEPLTILRGHNGPVWALAFSPDDKTLAAGSSLWMTEGAGNYSDGQVKLWDVTRAREITTLKGHAGLVSGLAFSPDGKTLTASDFRNEDQARSRVRVWDVAGAEKQGRQTIDGKSPPAVPSPDGKTVAGAIDLFAAATGEKTSTLDLGAQRFYGRATFSPDGKKLAALTQEGKVQVWDVATGNNSLTLDGMRGLAPPQVLAFGPDSRTLAVGEWVAADGDRTHRVALWDTFNGRRVGEIPVDNLALTAVAFSPDGKVLAVISGRGLELWGVANGARLAILTGDATLNYTVAFSHDGALLAAGCHDGTVKVWRLSGLPPTQ
jgi:WD40 repeat protein